MRFCNKRTWWIRSEEWKRAKTINCIHLVQNGVAEGKSKMLLEMARWLLIQPGLSTIFPAEAVFTVNYIRNRCTTNRLNGRTLFEMSAGTTLNISHLRELGGKVLILDSNSKKGMFEERTKKDIFLCDTLNNRKDTECGSWKKKTEISRDVKFVKEYQNGPNEDLKNFVPENFKNHANLNCIY